MTFLCKTKAGRVLMLFSALVLLGSCRTVQFYSQAALGQWEMLHKARPIDEVIADPKSSAELKRKLRLVLELRTFAKEHLHLPSDKPFQDYTDLGRQHVVWVVYAAPEFSVEAKEWWYPLVGSLKYRGFFKEADAKAEGERLKAQGLDVFVGGVDAYSTLGFFADPILNTFLRRSDAELAELIFHELTHVRVFVGSDTDFNEALAIAVGEHGVHAWLRYKGDAKALREYDQHLAKDREIIQLLLRTRETLKTAYATKADKRVAKTRCFSAMQSDYAAIKQRWTGDSRYDRFFAVPMNNARLNTVATYYDQVPKFEKLLKDCGYDLEKFFEKVEQMDTKQ